jgi:hypothetical protein
MSKENRTDLVRTLALVGARTRLAELRAETAEIEQFISALRQQAAPKPGPKGARRGRRRKHTANFRAKIAREAMMEGVTSTARKHGLSKSAVYRWISEMSTAQKAG